MRTDFESRFKEVNDEHTLLLQFSHLKKEVQEPMHDFIAIFNKIMYTIPTTKRPNVKNKKGFFMNAMPPNISFHLRRNILVDVDAV